jgi:hypothetical protein
VNGTVEFFLCGPAAANCLMGGNSLGNVTLANGSATSNDTTPNAVGTWCFRAEYKGDAQWLPSQDGNSQECFKVTAAPPKKQETVTASLPSRPIITLGEKVNDTAIVVPVDANLTENVSGEVEFFLCGVGTAPCTMGGASIGNVTLVNGSATSPDQTPDAVGTWCFRAEYKGNDTWLPSKDAHLNECFEVVTLREETTTKTTPSTNATVVGTPVTDEANVTAHYGKLHPVTRLLWDGTPTGNVSFFICDVNVVPCLINGTFLGNVTLENGTATSPPFTPTAPGTYCFRAEYNGDKNFAPSKDASEGECFTVRANIPFFPTVGALALGVLGTAGVVGAVLVMRRR